MKTAAQTRRAEIAADGERIASFRARRDANNAAAAAKAIATRRAQATALVTKLQALIANVPADGSWAQAGDLGHYVEQLQYLTGERG